MTPRSFTSRLRHAATLPVVLGLALAATACSNTSAPANSSNAAGDGKTVLRGVFANTSDPFWSSVACGATKEAKEKGVDFKVYASKSTEATELQTNFNAALLDKPQGLIVDAPSVDAFSGRMDQLQQQGVPVSVGVDVNPPVYNQIVGNQDAPPEVVQMGADVLKDGGSVFTVGGSAAVPIVADRYRYLLEELGKLNGVTILPVQFTDFDPTKTQVAVNSAILANPDLKLIVAATGPETTGVLAALEQAKRTDIKVIATDAVPSSVQALRDGKLMTIMSTPVDEFGRLQVDALTEFIDGHKGSTDPVGEPKNTTIKIGYLTQENIDDPDSQGLIYKTTCDE